MPLSKADIIAHVREHTKYPSTKGELTAACADMSDIPKADKQWIQQNLPDRTYNTADEVIRALKL
jgi:DNA-binding HxlR family transcriptional regulator